MPTIATACQNPTCGNTKKATSCQFHKNVHMPAIIKVVIATMIKLFAKYQRDAKI